MSADAPRLPDFLGIGAQKCGTGWLDAQLRRHPDIFMPEKKELHFFDSQKKSLSWYAEQFRAVGAKRLCGEITPRYMVIPDGPEKIRALLPDVRLLCILRHPVERAVSQWRMARRLGNMPADVSFGEAFSTDLREMRTRGRYVDHLRRYHAVFDARERLHVLFYDDLCERPADFLRSALDFLGVARHESVSVGLRVGASQTAEMPAEGELRAALDYYAAPTRELEDYLGRSLSAWKTIA